MEIKKYKLQLCYDFERNYATKPFGENNLRGFSYGFVWSNKADPKDVKSLKTAFYENYHGDTYESAIWPMWRYWDEYRDWDHETMWKIETGKLKEDILEKTDHLLAIASEALA